MKSKYMGNRPLLTIKVDSASLSRRKYVYDTPGAHLGTIRMETWNLESHYYAETPTGEKRLFELESKFGLSGSKDIVSFVNVVNGQQEQLFSRTTFGTHGTIENKASGTAVADINREMWKMRTEYHVTVAPGVGIVLIVGICISLDDKAKRSSMAAVAGGGGGA